MLPEGSSLLMILGILGLGVIIIIAILFLKRRSGIQKIPVQKNGRLAYQPQPRPVPAVPPGSIPRPVSKQDLLPQPKETSILDGRTSITESLRALAEKYSLEEFTIATSDGLVFASSGSDNAQNDAARYSERYASDNHSVIPGVVLSGFPFKGSDLILIIRTPHTVPENILTGIQNDTKDILNWWI